METRKSDVIKNILDSSYREIEKFRSTPKLKSGAYIIGRLLYLTKKQKNKKHLSKKDAANLVAKELENDWIGKNVYPKNWRQISANVELLYNTFTKHCKVYARRLDRIPPDGWNEEASEFNRKMQKNAFDIRTTKKDFQKRCEKEHDITMLKSDEDFYQDNCFGSYTATCSHTVDKKWSASHDRKLNRQKSEEKKRKLAETEVSEAASNKKRQYEELLQDSTPEKHEEEYFPDISGVESVQRSTITTRFSKNILSTDDKTFPTVDIRAGHRSLNENVMRCLVKCLSDYKVSSNDLIGIVKDVGNIIFQQKWEEPPTKDSDAEHDHEPEDSSRSHVLPSRSTINNWLEDASYMNLKYVADTLMNKEDSVITIGTDDTTKAAGHKVFNVKADHITVSGPNMNRKILTTGYSETTSHSGEENAKIYEQKLKYLAILGDTTVDDIKSQIDFWMCDRAGDCKTMLEHLDIEEEKIIKCTAHVILGIDAAADNVFKKTEQKIGVQKLLKTTAGQFAFSSPKSSIHTLGQIAIAKLLSPSHAAQTISLYPQFIEYMKMNSITDTGFKGFSSNRFGRIADISRTFNGMREDIMMFFDEYINVNSNKLVLAVATYIESDWFLLCSKIYEELGNDIIFPLIEILGIDKAKKTKRNDRNWNGLKFFFQMKIEELKEKRKKLNNKVNEEDLLYNEVLGEVIETVQRQLSEMSFFTDENPGMSSEKLKYAPITNLGCESEFAKLDNRLKITGGTTPLDVLSRKNIISTNALLGDSNFTQLSTDEKKKEWKWGRNSEEVKKVKLLQKEFMNTLKINKMLALEKKKQLKRKNDTKCLNLLEKCKIHGGPVTPNNMNILDELNENQLISEIGYLRCTIAPDIKQKRRVKDESSGKYKMIKFPLDQLKQNIKNAVHPVDEIGDTKKLILEALKK